jgi:hypothetical protein
MNKDKFQTLEALGAKVGDRFLSYYWHETLGNARATFVVMAIEDPKEHKNPTYTIQFLKAAEGDGIGNMTWCTGDTLVMPA